MRTVIGLPDNPEKLAYRYGRSFWASPDSTLAVTSRTICDGLDSASIFSAPLIVRGDRAGVVSLFPSLPCRLSVTVERWLALEKATLPTVDRQERTYGAIGSIIGLGIMELEIKILFC